MYSLTAEGKPMSGLMRLLPLHFPFLPLPALLIESVTNLQCVSKRLVSKRMRRAECALNENGMAMRHELLKYLACCLQGSSIRREWNLVPSHHNCKIC